MKRAIFKITLSVGLLLMGSTSLRAQDTGLSGTNLEFYRPAIDPSGFLGVNSPHMMKAGHYSLNLSQSFTTGPLFQIAVNGAPVNIVDRVGTIDFTGAVGVSDFLTIGVDLPFHEYAREANFNSLANFTTRSLGDIRIRFKFRVLEEREKRPGLALLFTNTFPTGDEMKFLGTSNMVPGIELIAGKEFRDFSIAANVGANFPRQKNILGLNFDDQVTYAAGVKVPFGFLDPLLSVIGEIRGHLEPNQVQIATAPVEFSVGLRREFKKGWAVSGAGGGGWNNAIGNPIFRGIFSISFSPSGDRKKELPESIIADQIHTTVYFHERAIQPTLESLSWISEAAELFKQNPEIPLVLVEGHADRREVGNADKRLSRLRAIMVKKILVQKGVADEDRIAIASYGADRPIASNDTPSGRTLNRRVEILAGPLRRD